MTSMVEAHFSGMPFQSSIYGLTSLLTGESSHKVLMASSKRKVYCIEYSKSKSLIPSTREVQFTYIPGGAEIISIDAFNQACQEHDFVIGIAFVKSDSGGRRSQYFNIYSDWEPSNECVLDNIAQGCLSISLEFIPFHLTHIQLIDNGVKEMVWLLSGSDCKIHLFREDKSCQTYCEQSSLCFPEFEHLESVVLWMDFLTNSAFRLTALGCKDGCVIVSLVKLFPEIGILSSWNIQHDSPVSVVRLFKDLTLPNFLDSEFVGNEAECNPFDVPINLAVGNTLEISVIYRDILKKGLNFSSQLLLTNSKKFDCVTCCLVSDIDMDGSNELIFGTYGQELFVYKWNPNSHEDKGSYSVVHQQAFPNPLLSISYIDITGDGLKELLILTTRGLHILQHNLKYATNLCIERLKILIENMTKEEIHKMLSEVL